MIAQILTMLYSYKRLKPFFIEGLENRQKDKDLMETCNFELYFYGQSVKIYARTHR